MPRAVPVSKPTDPPSTVLLACCPPDGSDQGDRRLRAVLQRVQRDPARRSQLAWQQQFDARLSARVQELALPADLTARAEARWLRSRQRQTSVRGISRQPAFLAAILSLAFLLGWGSFVWVDRNSHFPGEEAVERLVNENFLARRTAPVPAADENEDDDNPHRLSLHKASGECGKLGDALFLEYGLEHYSVPEAFAHAQVAGYHVVNPDGEPIVVVVPKAPEDMFFLTFRAEGFRVKVKPVGAWKLLAGDRWAAAVQVRENHTCFVAVVYGNLDTLRSRLRQAGAKL